MCDSFYEQETSLRRTDRLAKNNSVEKGHAHPEGLQDGFCFILRRGSSRCFSRYPQRSGFSWFSLSLLNNGCVSSSRSLLLTGLLVCCDCYICVEGRASVLRPEDSLWKPRSPSMWVLGMEIRSPGFQWAPLPPSRLPTPNLQSLF